MKSNPSKFFIFPIILILVLLIFLNQINAEITVQTEELEGDLLIESIVRTYELTPAILEKGFLINLEKDYALRFEVQGKNYYLIVSDILENQIFWIVPGNRQLVLNLQQKGIIDINQNGELDIEVTLNKIENNRAEIFIKEFVEEKPIIGDYIQLFDVEVNLAEDIVFSTNDLNIFIKFTNFGEGPSEVDIIYSILDENNTEVYTGADTKIIYTEDSIIKNFGFLEIPPGDYKLSAKINYGNNQTAESEKDFKIQKRPLLSILMGPLLFILIITGFFIFIRFSHKYYENKRLLKSTSKKIKEPNNEHTRQ